VLEEEDTADNLKILHENAFQIKKINMMREVKTSELYDKDMKRPSKSRETVL
jgi:hypothetical protein